MDTPNETFFYDWPADWMVVGFPHEVSLDSRLLAAISAISTGLSLEANGNRINDLSAVADDPLLIVGSVMRLSDASGTWEVLCSNVGGFSLLGARPLVMPKAFDVASRATLLEEFELWVGRGRVGFGETGLALARDHLLPRLREP